MSDKARCTKKTTYNSFSKQSTARCDRLLRTPEQVEAGLCGPHLAARRRKDAAVPARVAQALADTRLADESRGLADRFRLLAGGEVYSNGKGVHLSVDAARVVLGLVKGGGVPGSSQTVADELDELAASVARLAERYRKEG